MKKRTRLTAYALFGLLFIAGIACSDDTTAPRKDGSLNKKDLSGSDSATDGPLVKKDGAHDGRAETSQDRATDQAMDKAADKGTLDLAPGDQAPVDKALVDKGTLDLVLADKATKEKGISPDGAPADSGAAGDGAPPTFTPPFTWDFESSCMGLSATKDWQCGQLAFVKGTNCGTYTPVPPTGGASGTGKGMWGTKLNDCYSNLGNNDGANSSTCSNTKPADDSILSFKVTLPSTWTTATLTYYEYVDVNGYFDWMEVRVDSTSVKAYCNPSKATSSTTWVKQTINLSSYVGKTITIAFHLMASTVVSYSGWYLDDMSVSGS